MAETRAEQETHFRWDNEGRTLEAWTADPRVAARWRRAKFRVGVLGKTRDGKERTWEVVLAWDGHKRPWTRLFSAAVRDFHGMGPLTRSAPVDPGAEDDDSRSEGEE